MNHLAAVGACLSQQWTQAAPDPQHAFDVETGDLICRFDASVGEILHHPNQAYYRVVLLGRIRQAWEPVSEFRVGFSFTARKRR